MRRRRYLSLCGLAAASAVAAGCTDGGNGDGGDDGDGGLNNEILVERVRGTLESEGAEIHELSDEGDVVVLEYSPGNLPDDADGSEIETRVEETVRAVSQTFYEPIVGPGSGWRADHLDATVTVDGAVVATYRLETAWAEECSGTGDTRACLEERVQGSVERPQVNDDDSGSGTVTETDAGTATEDDTGTATATADGS